MLICAFPPHYQLVYISFDISSFSVISYALKAMRLHSKSNAIAKHGEWNWIKERFLQDFKDEQKEVKWNG